MSSRTVLAPTPLRSPVVPAQLGSLLRNWRRVKPTPGCAVATRCRTSAFRNPLSSGPLRYFEVEVALFRNVATARSQYARVLQPFAGSRHDAQRSRQGFRYTVVGGLGSLQLPGRDIGSTTDAKLAVIAQRGRYLQVALISADASYLARNAK